MNRLYDTAPMYGPGDYFFGEGMIVYVVYVDWCSHDREYKYIVSASDALTDTQAVWNQEQLRTSIYFGRGHYRWWRFLIPKFLRECIPVYAPPLSLRRLR